MNTSKDLIAEFYGIEADTAEIKEQDMFEMKITVKVPANTVYLLKALAQRFNTTRFDLVRPVLVDATSQMFISLTPEDRKAIAEIADKEVHSYLLNELGVTEFKSKGAAGVVDESSYWRDLASVYDSFDKKGDDHA